MQAIIDEKDGIYVLSLRGQLDFESADTLRTHCRRFFNNQKVIFNLERLNFVGSSGLTPFVDLLKDMQTQLGSNLKICSPQHDFIRLFETSELQSLEIYECENKAHNAFIFADFLEEAKKRARNSDKTVRKGFSSLSDGPMEEDGE